MGQVDTMPAAVNSGRAGILWLALSFAMIFPTLLALVHFVYLAHEGDTGNPAQQLAYAGGKAIQFGLPLLCLALFEQRLPRPSWPSSKGLALGVGFGVGVVCRVCADRKSAAHSAACVHT